MTADSASVGALALAWCLAAAASGLATRVGHAQEAPAAAQQAPAATQQAPVAGRIAFDIEAQRLGDAIEIYSRMTGLDVLLDAQHAQRVSGGVRGSFTPREALDAMLAGTGLQARTVGANALVVQAQTQAPSANAEPFAMPEAAGMEESGFMEGEVVHQSYAAQVQQALRGILCASALTRPGSYRLALQLRLDARGVAERFRLLSTTGEPARDAAVLQRVRSLAVGSPPPPSLPQPLVILLLPEGPGAQADCARAAAAAAPAAPAPAP